MNLHEFQAKHLFAEYGLQVPAGQMVASLGEARVAARALGGERWVVKAQVHAGGRGKGGGVRLVTGEGELESAVKAMLGMNLVTHQTGPKGLPVDKLLVEATCDIVRELYLGALIDRARNRVVFMASSEGGMDIEAVAAETPEKILTVAVDPVAGLQGYQCRQLAFGLGLEGAQVRELTRTMLGLYRLFTEKDLSLVEINPLVLTADDHLLALDAKVNVDDNALFRQKVLEELRDPTQEDPTEHKAQQFDLNYVTLDGNIGCMVNGAGLAMATMDIIKLHGGEPANFLDVGGGTTAERVAEALKLIVADYKVEAILVNIFGGIVRCDLIADGIVAAIKEVGLEIPVVVRLEGTNAEQGREILAHSGLAVIPADDLADAAAKVVAAGGQG
ncbi:Succinyl-CoA ligase [ADP-forming] beta chain [hydrothermal vent metagenome]|uniref:Succinyl-CoA ligase [ADP-forming] beta chain n=1 Tax=hydrothermal vent metagenome TaxID=652676 RepID=A0A3B1AQJ6_9ZZZZ